MMNSEISTPRLKLVGKHLVGFDTGSRSSAHEAVEAADRATVAKVGAVKLGMPKPGVVKPAG